MKPSIFYLMNEYFKEYKDKDWATNAWLYGLEMEIYVRKGHHFLIEEKTTKETYLNSLTTCLDIANVTVYDKGRGVFSMFLREMEKIQPWDAIYVESVQTERFCRHLERCGYVKQLDSIPPAYYKFK